MTGHGRGLRTSTPSPTTLPAPRVATETATKPPARPSSSSETRARASWMRGRGPRVLIGRRGHLRWPADESFMRWTRRLHYLLLLPCQRRLPLTTDPSVWTHQTHLLRLYPETFGRSGAWYVRTTHSELHLQCSCSCFVLILPPHDPQPPP